MLHHVCDRQKPARTAGLLPYTGGRRVRRANGSLRVSWAAYLCRERGSQASCIKALHADLYRNATYRVNKYLICGWGS